MASTSPKTRYLTLDLHGPVQWHHDEDPTPRESALLTAEWRMRLDRQFAEQVIAIMENCLHCRIRVTPAQAAHIFTRNWGGDSGPVLRLLRAVDRILGRVEYPNVNFQRNPNNGMLRFTLDVGNEYSEVLYIETYAGKPFTDDERRKLRNAAAMAGADEVDFVTDDTLRIWWD